MHALKCFLAHRTHKLISETLPNIHAREWSFSKLSATWANPAESFLAGTALHFLNLLDFRLSQQRPDTPLI